MRDVLPAVLTRLGTGGTAAQQEDILATLELVRESFPTDIQLYHLFRMLLDTQAHHNLKVQADVEHQRTVLCDGVVGQECDCRLSRHATGRRVRGRTRVCARHERISVPVLRQGAPHNV